MVEVGDLGAGDGPLVGEVEVVEGFDLGDVGGFDPMFAAVGFSGGDFFGEDLGQELEGIPAFGAGGFRQGGGDVAGSGHLQGPGEVGDLGGRAAHELASTRAS